MRGIGFALATLSLLSTTGAIELRKRSAPSVVGFEIERKRVANPIEHDRARRGWKRQEGQDEEGKWVMQDLDNEVRATYPNRDVDRWTGWSIG